MYQMITYFPTHRLITIFGRRGRGVCTCYDLAWDSELGHYLFGNIWHEYHWKAFLSTFTWEWCHHIQLPFSVMYDMGIIGKHFLSTFTWEWCHHVLLPFLVTYDMGTVADNQSPLFFKSHFYGSRIYQSILLWSPSLAYVSTRRVWHK